MSVFTDVLIISSSFVIFAVIHSLAASLKFKIYLKNTIGDSIAFYRLFYNAVSIVLLYYFLTIVPKPDVMIYELDTPYDIIILIFQIAALIMLFWVISKIDIAEFLGIAQISRFLKNQRDKNELDEKPVLYVDGFFKYSRHPIYFFSILFLSFRPQMSLFYFTLLICIIIYFYIGSYLEEKRMSKNFGAVYTEYAKKTPRIIPIKIFKPNKL